MRSIQDIPLLDRDELCKLAREMRSQQQKFEAALFAIPGTARLVLERWETRRGAGLVTAALSRHYRDGSGRNWSRHIDIHLERVSSLLEQGPPPRAEIAAGLDAADISFDLLLEIHQKLLEARVASGRRRRDFDRRRRLGLASASARASLTRATNALAAYHRAMQTIAHHNLRLVVKCARKFRKMGVPLADLIQEGNLGLIRAIEKFDPERGFMFSTYAVWWIQQALIRAIQNQRRTVRVPSHICEIQVRYRHAAEALGRRLGRDPESLELAAELGLPLEQVETIEATMAPVRSIHSPVPGLDSVTLEDALPDRDTVNPIDDIDREQLRTAVGSLMRTLSPRERKILDWRFGLGADGDSVTLGEIGRRLGISRERVRQIESAALARLRQLPRVRQLRHSVDVAEVGEAS
jgi:RNA polymerase sigma factor (sigma-70 family)